MRPVVVCVWAPSGVGGPADKVARRKARTGKDTRRVDVSLVLVQPDGGQREVPLKRSRLLIGRKVGCELRIASPSVSREHCELRVEGDTVRLRDLGSSNGTLVNGQRVQEAELGAGDVLSVGSSTFVMRIDGEPGRIDPDEVLQRAAPPSQKSGGPDSPGQKPGAPSRRPSAPTPAGGGAAKPSRSLDDSDDLLTALSGTENDASSVIDFDLDLDDDEDDKQPGL